MAELTDAVTRAVRGMSWLTGADDAAVKLAPKYAAQIEAGVEDGDGSKALYLGPHLLNALSAGGGTPRGRKDLEVKETPGGKLAAVRDLRGQQKSTKGRGKSSGSARRTP